MTDEILVIGAGAVGAFYASRIPLNQASVSVVCRSNFETVKKQSGFLMETRSFGNYVFSPRIFSSLDSALKDLQKRHNCKEKNFDFVLIATKALPESLVDLSPLYNSSKSPTIVLIQNGIGIEEPYAVKYPSSPLLSCVTAISSAQTQPGKIVQYRWTRIHIGPFPTRGATEETGLEQAKRLADLFLYGGIKDAFFHNSEYLQMLRWHKLMINASFSPSAVLSGGFGTADLASNPIGRLHIKECMREIQDVAHFILRKPFPKELADVESILNSTERNVGAKISMLLDWESQKPMEIETILGNPIRMAQDKGLKMPRLETMYHLLRLKQQIQSKL